MHRCCQFCFIAFLFCLCARSLTLPDQAAAAPDSVAAARLGSATVSILEGATRVETFRVGAPAPYGDSPPPGRIDGHRLNGKGQTKGKAFASKAAKILLDPRLYSDARDRCLFSPGAVFRLWKGKEYVDCLMCFHCNDVLILTQDPQGHTLHTTFTNFTARRSALLALVKQAFPADKEIQALPAK